MQHKNVPSTVVYMLLIPISLPGINVSGGMWLCYEVKCLPLAHQSLNFLFGLQLQYVILYFNSDILKEHCKSAKDKDCQVFLSKFQKALF